MPEHASRVPAAFYDQQSDDPRVSDWGGDELFTRMPRPRAVDDAPPPRFRPSSGRDGSAGRTVKVITGHPEGAPRPLPTVPAARRRPARTPAEWIGPRPERMVAWAFALGLLLILIAISTADAATL